MKYVKDFHASILVDLFDENHSVFDAVENLFVEIEWALEGEPRPSYSYEYDQIVSLGELYLQLLWAIIYFKLVLIMYGYARDVIKTDNKHQAARIDWDLTTKLVQKNISKDQLIITQGFIGCTSKNFFSWKGSDYSAAIFATILKAKKLVIWKDVPGVLNADPRYFDDPKKVDNISFQEAIELAFYGATVIHPKTLQPLKRNKIPLEVRSFIKFEEKGTWISEGEVTKPDTSFFILKKVKHYCQFL